jgi:GH15 family glucan-1,4-alpha-glucosidase
MTDSGSRSQSQNTSTRYRPIEACGIIGNLRSIALVSTEGTIDWCCLPRFDSPSVFASLLDAGKGGRFSLAPEAKGVNRQMYLPETNVLMTRFLRPDGVGEILDFMPMREDRNEAGNEHHSEIIRIVRCVRGNVQFVLDCQPAFDFGREPHRISIHPDGAVFESESGSLILSSPVPLEVTGTAVSARFHVPPKESLTFRLRFIPASAQNATFHPDAAPGDAEMESTVQFWRKWVNRCTYTGRWREKVLRSALVLKLLTYEPTGAIVAAATTSLPEEIGGERNWDYRYTWIRDAAFTVFAFLRMGFTEEAGAFFHWLEQRAHEPEQVNGPLNIMYAIDGKHELTEATLDHLEGYKNSRPVRIGNAAYNQLQLDIYGELIDSLYLYDKYADAISYSLWLQIRKMLEWVAKNWNQPDEGLWEVRSERQHFVYSKLQCWVALDRGMRLAARHSLPIDRELIERERDLIYHWIMTAGWDPHQKSFVQAAGSKALDASNLIMPLVYFISPKDPRMLGTLERTMEVLVSDSLVYRYRLEGEHASDDGVEGGEGTFSMCTFWLVEALARAGRLEDARFIFEKMLTYANHLGLYSEEIGPTGEALGNFPQAFTHLGLVTAAIALNNRLDAQGGSH